MYQIFLGQMWCEGWHRTCLQCCRNDWSPNLWHPTSTQATSLWKNKGSSYTNLILQFSLNLPLHGLLVLTPQQCSINSPASGPLPPDAPSWCQAPFDPEGLLRSTFFYLLLPLSIFPFFLWKDIMKLNVNQLMQYCNGHSNLLNRIAIWTCYRTF